jgi:hypothetical protein
MSKTFAASSAAAWRYRCARSATTPLRTRVVGRENTSAGSSAVAVIAVPKTNTQFGYSSGGNSAVRRSRMCCAGSGAPVACR